MADVVEIELHEPGHRPEVERIRLEPGEDFRLAFSAGKPPLRRFLLRGADRQLADPHERPFLWLRAPDAARPWIRVTQVDDSVVDVPRIRTADKLLVAVEQDRKLGARTALVVRPPEERSLDLELRVAGRRVIDVSATIDEDGSPAGEGGDEDEIEELETDAPALDWQVPGVWESYGQPLMLRWTALRERVFQKLRPPPGLLRGMSVAAGMLALAGYSLYSHRQAQAARAAADDSLEAMENASAAAEASAQDAGQCRTELAALQRGLLAPAAARRSLILAALDTSLARAKFMGLVSHTAERDEALAVGEATRGDLVASVERSLAERPLSPEMQAWARGRVELAAYLAGELPEHVLLWYPRPAELPTAAPLYWSRGGASLVGPFALGERPLRMIGSFDGPLDGGEAADPRPQRDWSLQTLTASLTAWRSALLAWTESSAGGAGRRMAVPPEELDLWTLALFSAWNEMVMNDIAGDIGECSRSLLDSLERNQTAEPGDAVLPSVLEVVANDEWVWAVDRTAACPWRDADLLAGVQQAMDSVTLHVALAEAPEAED